MLTTFIIIRKGDFMIKREMYLKKIRETYDMDIIKIITGIRRCGKSVLLKQIIEELLQKGLSKDWIRCV